jgi:hypothetical protein
MFMRPSVPTSTVPSRLGCPPHLEHNAELNPAHQPVKVRFMERPIAPPSVLPANLERDLCKSRSAEHCSARTTNLPTKPCDIFAPGFPKDSLLQRSLEGLDRSPVFAPVILSGIIWR